MMKTKGRIRELCATGSSYYLTFLVHFPLSLCWEIQIVYPQIFAYLGAIGMGKEEVAMGIKYKS